MPATSPPPENGRMATSVGRGSAETCWTLVRRAAAGDASSRSRFGRTYLPLVRGFLVARWRGTSLASDVEDAVQDVFVECFRDDGALAHADSDKGSFRGFLYGIVRHVALRVEGRARHAQQEGTRMSPEIAADEPTVAELFDREWAQALMREAADLMRQNAGDDGARLRVELLRLRFGADLPVREIAARWSMELSAVHRAYARAREEFRHCLRQVVAFNAVRTEAELDDECRRLFELLG